MRRSSRASRWLCSCSVLVIGVAAACAQDPPSSSACNLPPPGGCPPKIVVHLPPPEVVYDQTEAPCPEKHCKFCLLKHCQRAAPAAAASASVLTPLETVTNGVLFGQTVSSGVGLNAVGLGGVGLSGVGLYGLGMNGAGLQSVDNDFANIRAAQELELMAARVASLQAARDAEVRVESASLQRVQAHLASLSLGNGAGPEAVQPHGVKPQSVDAPAGQQLQAQIDALKARMDKLDQKIDDVSKLCHQIGGRLGDK